MSPMRNLIERGIFRLATEPDGQPREPFSGVAGYTVPLLAHDYPALTARLWNTAYASFQYPFQNCMVVVDPAHLEEILPVLRSDAQYLGGGVGVGLKDIILDHLDHVDPVARAMGAVNIIVRSPDGALTGYNTDGAGFVRGLLPFLGARELRHAVVIGAGGAGNAIAFALAMHGVRVVIVNRTVEKASRLAHAINAYLALCEPSQSPQATAAGEDELQRVVSERTDLVVNTTTKGQGALAAYSALGPIVNPGDRSDIQANHVASARVLERLPEQGIVADIVIARAPTPLLEQARTAGLHTMDGIPMVVEQAIDAFGLVHPSMGAREAISNVMWAQVQAKQPT